jgi:glycosyltransferase involved in cell wall biosynthesis
MARVALVAFACDPSWGSEPGTGWLWAKAAADTNEVVVLTTPRGASSIANALHFDPQTNLSFRFVDVPRWPTWLRRWHYGYYFAWQVLAFLDLRRLNAERPFDLIHHVTYSNVWLPSFASLVGLPFVLGPLCGGSRVPLALYSELGLRGALQEGTRVTAQTVNRLNPFTRATWRRASVIVTNNAEVASRLPPSARARSVVRPQVRDAGDLVQITDLPESDRSGIRPSRPTALCVGRLLTWKGFSVAIRALQLAPAWQLEIVGAGKARERLEQLARDLDLGDRVSFRAWTDRPTLCRLMSDADAVIVPSLRDEGPFVALESLVLGTPVIASDVGAIREYGARCPGVPLLLVERKRADLMAAQIAEYLARLDSSRVRAMRPKPEPSLSIELPALYAAALARQEGA